MSITVQTLARHEERLSSAFEDVGALAITLLDARDQPIYEPAPGKTPLWNRLTMQALFAADADARSLLFALNALQPGLDLARATIEHIADRDWQRAWMDDFQPMRFGRQLWIVPSDHELPEPARADDAVVLRLDPGLAFGSGSHATTALCLAWLEGTALADRRVLDFGCGSGVLAVAAARLGASQVIAVDNDPQALTATADNAAANGVADAINIAAAEDWQPASDCDVVVANILANTLIELAPHLCAALKPEGVLALSGVLPGQQEEVIARYRSLGIELAAHEHDGWLLLARRDDPAAAGLAHSLVENTKSTGQAMTDASGHDSAADAESLGNSNAETDTDLDAGHQAAAEGSAQPAAAAMKQAH
ncbi:MAG: 50S ribosomal protein L11 methyltransferase [Xanthomonadales bacterium]|nr:50S ribosomal protein L11 methyltransferase [Xanthomonadales bacterium]